MTDADKPKAPTIVADPTPEPKTLIGGLIDVDQVPIDPNGCPQCDDFPTFPRKHCGRPACRDAQAVAWASAVGCDPSEVLAVLDGDATADDGLCGGCALVKVCVLGRMIVDTQTSLNAQLAQCAGFKTVPP